MYITKLISLEKALAVYPYACYVELSWGNTWHTHANVICFADVCWRD